MTSTFQTFSNVLGCFIAATNNIFTEVLCFFAAICNYSFFGQRIKQTFIFK